MTEELKKKERVLDFKRGELWIRQLIDEGKKFSKYSEDYHRVKLETGLYFGEIEEIYWRIVREKNKNIKIQEA